MISALVIKAAILISVTGLALPTVTDGAISLVFFYYFFLELFPIFVVLIFYRVEPLHDSIEDDEEGKFGNSLLNLFHLIFLYYF